MASTDEAIEAIYAAGYDGAGWRDAAERIAALLRTATGSFYLNRNTPAGVEAEILASFGHGDRAIAAYVDYFSGVNPFDRRHLDFAVGEAVTDAGLDRRLTDMGAFERSEYYNDWVRPQHFRHVIGCYVERSAAATLVSAFWRPADAGAFSDDESRTFLRLMRHAARSSELAARLRTARSNMEAVPSPGRAAVFTLGRDGRMRQSNAVADALLSDGRALRLEGGRLVAVVADDQPGLDRLIACAFDVKRLAWAENARLSIRRADGGPPLVVRIVANAQRFGAFAPDRVAACVLTVEGFEAETASRAERLRRRFGLTKAQARLALALAKGRSLSEAANGLGIGHETARSHLKAVFARTDTHRQVELVLLLRDLEGV